MSQRQPGTPARRVVGIDYGARRVGIAVSDPLGIFAQPLGTMTPADAIARLLELDEEPGLDAIVVGWPLDPSGREGPATEAVEEYIGWVREALPDVEIVRWDERGSSRDAVAELVRAGSRRKHRAKGGAADRVAAALLLQQYLDERNAGRDSAF